VKKIGNKVVDLCMHPTSECFIRRSLVDWCKHGRELLIHTVRRSPRTARSGGSLSLIICWSTWPCSPLQWQDNHIINKVCCESVRRSLTYEACDHHVCMLEMEVDGYTDSRSRPHKEANYWDKGSGRRETTAGKSNGKAGRLRLARKRECR
jgi:hypothetical protein